MEPLVLGEYEAFKPPSSINVPEQVVKLLVPLAGNAYVWARRPAGQPAGQSLTAPNPTSSRTAAKRQDSFTSHKNTGGYVVENPTIA